MMRATALLLVTTFAISGCEPDIHTGPVRIPPPTPLGGAEGDAADADASVPSLTLGDDNFVESELNRDPFRSFASAFHQNAPDQPQRTVKLSNTVVDEMRLIAILTGVASPRAMILDASGVGVVVERGDYIGRAEVVQLSGDEGLGVTLNWRIDRIRRNEVVLTREDPTGPEHPPLTRVLTLHSPEELAAAAPRSH